MQRTPNKSVIRARELRRTMSLPEGMLWQILRKRPGGFKFRRQHLFGPFVVDFFCAARQLAIEVDGEVHSMGTEPVRDKNRDAFLRRQGVRVVRFDAKDVFQNMDNVVRTILAEASA